MKKYEVIEDNGGGLSLAIFDEAEQVEYLHYYDTSSCGILATDLIALQNGDDPVTDWDGNADDPQAEYNHTLSYQYGWEIVADNDGIYWDKMGAAATEEFELYKIKKAYDVLNFIIKSNGGIKKEQIDCLCELIDSGYITADNNNTLKITN